MKLSPKDIRAAGVDPKAWARYVRNPYGAFWGYRRLPAMQVQGGPYDGQRINLRDPYTGTSVIRVRNQVGRYVWANRGYRHGQPYGYLTWETQ